MAAVMSELGRERRMMGKSLSIRVEWYERHDSLPKIVVAAMSGAN